MLSEEHPNPISSDQEERSNSDYINEPHFTDNSVNTSGIFFVEFSKLPCSKKCRYFLRDNYFFPGICCIWFFVALIIILSLLSTMPQSYYGESVIATSYPILVATFDPGKTHNIVLYQRNDSFTANLYDNVCSGFELQEHSLNYTKSLDDQPYQGIGEFYMVKSSTIHFFFPSPDLPPSVRCVANVYIFTNPSNYFGFIAREVHNLNLSYCLPPDSPLNFTLTAHQNNKYYFVGVENFASTIFNYTVTGRILQYNVTDLSSTTCTFPTHQFTSCSISLSDYPEDKDVCILATSQDANNSVTLSYVTQYYRRQRRWRVVYAMMGVVFAIPGVTIIFRWIYKRIKKCRQQRCDSS